MQPTTQPSAQGVEQAVRSTHSPTPGTARWEWCSRAQHPGLLRRRTERLKAPRPADQARAPVAVGERHRQPPTRVTDERVQLLTRLRPEFHERHIKTHCGGALTANFAAIASRSRSVTAWSPGCSRYERDSLGLLFRQHTPAESANRASAQRFLFFLCDTSAQCRAHPRAAGRRSLGHCPGAKAIPELGPQALVWRHGTTGALLCSNCRSTRLQPGKWHGTKNMRARTSSSGLPTHGSNRRDFARQC
jgi:hypothetical protein